MVGPLGQWHGINKRTLFPVLLVVFFLFMAILISSGLKSTLKPALAVPGPVNQPLQASLQSRPQPNYLKHAGEGQAYMHKLLVQSGGNFDRLNVGDQTFVEAVLGGHARRYFPMMYRGMTSKSKPGAAAPSKYVPSGATNQSARKYEYHG